MIRRAEHLLFGCLAEDQAEAVPVARSSLHGLAVAATAISTPTVTKAGVVPTEKVAVGRRATE